MRICVLGSSSSEGQGNDSHEQAWPWLLAARLEAVTGEPVEVDHHKVYFQGEKAVSRAMRIVDESNAELVILNYGSVACAIQTVGNRVRNRFGDRAYRLFRKAETTFEAGPPGPAKQATRMNRWGRWLARHTIGVEPNASFADTTRIQCDIIHGLARFEDKTVVIFSAPDLPRLIVKDNKGADEIFIKLRANAEAAARQHHFLIANANIRYSAHPDRDNAYYQSDLLHRTVEGQRVEAEALFDVLLTPPSPYAPAIPEPAPTDTPPVPIANS